MSFLEFRDSEDNLIFETDSYIFSVAYYNPGKVMEFNGKRYEVIDSFLKDTKRSYWWSLGIKFNAFKLNVYVEEID